MVTLQLCTRCREIKDTTDFYPSNKYYCIPCNRAMSASSRAKRKVGPNGEVLTRKQRDQQEQKKQERKKLIKETVKKEEFNPSGLTKYWPGSTMKAALGRYKGLHHLQKGLCAVCKKPETALSQTGKLKRLAVDHCHKTGKVRGLLCTSCNTRVVSVIDNQDHLIEAAREYLKIS